MILNDESTWPAAVVRYLEKHHDLFLGWEQRQADHNPALINFELTCARAAEYDRAIYGFRDVLKSYSLRGYHCTRLTQDEIDYIRSNGMQPPNAAILSARIQRLQNADLLNSRIADRLRQDNQADEDNRAGRIWFCFYPPHFAGQDGLQRLFRSWGGEALYNSHERDAITGPLLQKIGMPCLIEAEVSIASLCECLFLETHFCRQFLVNRGLQTSESLHHEDCAMSPIPSSDIKRIIRFTEPKFIN